MLEWNVSNYCRHLEKLQISHSNAAKVHTAQDYFCQYCQIITVSIVLHSNRSVLNLPFFFNGMVKYWTHFWVKKETEKKEISGFLPYSVQPCYAQNRLYTAFKVGEEKFWCKIFNGWKDQAQKTSTSCGFTQKPLRKYNFYKKEIMLINNINIAH